MIFQLSQKCAQRVSRNAVLPDRLLPENLVPDAEFLIFEDLPDRGVLVRELLRLSLFETEHVILAGDRRRGFQPESRYETSESELQVAVVPQPYRHLIAALDRKRTFTLPFHFLGNCKTHVSVSVSMSRVISTEATLSKTHVFALLISILPLA